MSLIHIRDLPSEALLKIFHYLSWNELKTCGIVCRGWGIAAHEVSELKWKDLCKTEFGEVYENAYRKAELSWEDLHKSLSSWSQVKSCKVFCKYSELLESRYVPQEEKEIKKMQYLKNGLIGYPFYIVDEYEPLDFTGEQTYSNCITYYNAKTLQMFNSVTYDYDFDAYVETDDMIVLREREMKLYIITKPNKTVHCVGEMLDYFDDKSRFFVIKNKVFYLTTDYTFWVTKLVNERGVATLDSIPLIPPEACEKLGRIQAVACINDYDNIVNILMEDGGIYSVVEKQATKLCQIEKKDRNKVMNTLKLHGFFWNSPPVYSWMCSGTNSMSVTHLKGAIVHSYFDRVIIVGTLQRVIHIYYNPYRNGQLKIFKAKPTLTIDLSGWVPTIGAWPRYVSDSQRKIIQIEVIEIKDGHRILLLYCQRLVGIELRLDPPKRSGQQSSEIAVGVK